MTLCRYGGVVEREAVVAGADWFVNDWADLEKALKRYKVWSVFTRLLREPIGSDAHAAAC